MTSSLLSERAGGHPGADRVLWRQGGTRFHHAACCCTVLHFRAAAKLKPSSCVCASGYRQAKQIIHLITDVAQVINADSATNDKLKVFYFPPFFGTFEKKRLCNKRGIEGE
jgi:hypothetical protein